MSKIISIATIVPTNKYSQETLLSFAQNIYCKDEIEKRKLRYLYRQSGINHRYSVIPDYGANVEAWTFFPPSDDLEPFPGIEERMKIYNEYAADLSAKTITDCIQNKIDKNKITHLITVSCTGMSAPGLDLQVMELMGLPKNIIRTSVNFMGCYAAIHALKMADAFCQGNKQANVVIVCTEFCTLHFQKEPSIDNMTSSLLFSDGCAALLVSGNPNAEKGLQLKSFYSEVSFKGKKDMAWELSSKGFLMTLTGYVPDLIREDIKPLVDNALANAGKALTDVTHWCIHPGGKKILESICDGTGITKQMLQYSYDVLRDYGNMSSPTLIFVLEKFFREFEIKTPDYPNLIFATAFGPGLCMETFTASYE